MKTFRIFSLLFLLILAQLNAAAQFSSAQIGVDGLTCSACTRSVEMSIRKLNFVDSVSMNLEHTNGKIFFKKDAKVDVEKIAQAVVDAGFSVRSLTVEINIAGDLKASNDFCWDYQNNVYHFVKIPENTDLSGVVKLKFIGNEFMSGKEFKTWKMYCTSTCNSGAPSKAPHSKSYYVSLL